MGALGYFQCFRIGFQGYSRCFSTDPGFWDRFLWGDIPGVFRIGFFGIVPVVFHRSWILGWGFFGIFPVVWNLFLGDILGGFP